MIPIQTWKKFQSLHGHVLSIIEVSANEFLKVSANTKFIVEIIIQWLQICQISTIQNFTDIDVNKILELQNHIVYKQAQNLCITA